MKKSVVLGSIPRDTFRQDDGRVVHIVKLLFYQYADVADMMHEQGVRPTRRGEMWNWLAACWTGGGCHVSTQRVQMMQDAEAQDDVDPIFTHVELRFSNGYGTSITADEGRVHYEQRLHTRDNYSYIVELHVTPDEERKAEDLARNMHKDPSVGFNQRGFMLNFLPVVGTLAKATQHNNNVFCTQYIVLLLHEMNRLLDVDPRDTSPQQLYHIMRQEVRDGRAHISWNREERYAQRHLMSTDTTSMVLTTTAKAPTRKRMLLR